MLFATRALFQMTTRTMLAVLAVLPSTKATFLDPLARRADVTSSTGVVVHSSSTSQNLLQSLSIPQSLVPSLSTHISIYTPSTSSHILANTTAPPHVLPTAAAGIRHGSAVNRNETINAASALLIASLVANQMSQLASIPAIPIPSNITMATATARLQT